MLKSFLLVSVFLQIVLSREICKSDFTPKQLFRKNDEQLQDLPKNCKQLQLRGQTESGVHEIKPHDDGDGFMVWCDMETRGGGWIYLLNRFDGQLDFYRNWTEYKDGFGNLSGEMWLGLEKLFLLAGSHKGGELLIELLDWKNNKAYAYFEVFRISNEENGYTMEVAAGYEGNAGNSLDKHVGMKFSTADKDQDRAKNINCAKIYNGGWWYHACSDADLSGKYRQGRVESENDSIIFWGKFRGNKYSLKEAKMMIR